MSCLHSVLTVAGGHRVWSNRKSTVSKDQRLPSRVYCDDFVYEDRRITVDGSSEALGWHLSFLLALGLSGCRRVTHANRYPAVAAPHLQLSIKSLFLSGIFSSRWYFLFRSLPLSSNMHTTSRYLTTRPFPRLIQPVYIQSGGTAYVVVGEAVFRSFLFTSQTAVEQPFKRL